MLEPAAGISKPNPTEHGHGGASWEQEYRELEGAIKLRNYSGKTHAVYRMRVQKFQAFARSKPPGELNDEDVKRFLTDLAVRQEVAGSTQNQAFNALLFFFRHILQREFGKLSGVVRAKRKPYVPVVLSKAEVAAVIAAMEPPYRLVALLLYGCGLRLAECLELRVNCSRLSFPSCTWERTCGAKLHFAGGSVRRVFARRQPDAFSFRLQCKAPADTPSM